MTVPLDLSDQQAIAEATAQARARVARIGRMLFERHLTDAAGGNVSMRVGDLVCMSPRYSGSQRQWQLEADDVIVADLQRRVLLGAGQISRESHVHFSLYAEFSQHGSAVIHAHARNLLVFAALARPMPPILEATRKFGITPVVEFAPAHSPRLAERVAATMRGRESMIARQAAGTIAPWHGLFVMGKDIDAAFDAVERLDTNAYCLLMGQLLGGGSIDERYAAMEATVNSFSED